MYVKSIVIKYAFDIGNTFHVSSVSKTLTHRYSSFNPFATEWFKSLPEETDRKIILDIGIPWKTDPRQSGESQHLFQISCSQSVVQLIGSRWSRDQRLQRRSRDFSLVVGRQLQSVDSELWPSETPTMPANRSRTTFSADISRDIYISWWDLFNFVYIHTVWIA